MTRLSQIEIIPRWKEQYGLSTFVETGCYLGDGIATALAWGFECVFSCDLHPDHVEHCRRRFAEEIRSGRVAIFEGDSIAVLEGKILPAMGGPALIYLDAHFPAYYGLAEVGPSTRFPLREELDAIRRHRAGKAADVVLCDDMRVIESPDNPTFCRDLPRSLVVTEFGLDSLRNALPGTHEAVLLNVGESVLALLPVSQESLPFMS